MTGNESDSIQLVGIRKLQSAAVIAFTLLAYSARDVAAYIVIALLPIAVIYGLLRLMRYSRKLGISVIALVLLFLGTYATLLYKQVLRHTVLLSELEQYSEVYVQRKYFPLPYVYSLSIDRGDTDDADFARILKLDGLEYVTDLYLENSHLTDQSLEIAKTAQHLKYVFIDCKEMTDNAIILFEDEHPSCRVVAYKRRLHDDGGVEVFLGPPPE